ncbi:hypothetical protein LTR35_009413 [Friedmanniomyces endolithicus]|uniref:GRF-type domain-containing protein n=1 Tax=Friedmanniomyces endolithicus TaxID=329885 RepID=A0AAN6FCN1_9PEZI|nr:hypothetical protein LTR35_009413 [Friedmanniomyces endolithicus]KAK0290756.1 hypothetical protein LTS00_008532 [Friedmanniomyces endolithicus]KAK0314205.1 hypothetical protein LTR82_013130 [Friedmanniomyces endolithicus]KAK0997848.1 hypothetical protein LTR54_009645 [Friedmanniomyces endolithicus]
MFGRGGRYRGRGGSSSYRGGRGGQGSAHRAVLKGLFADGIWQCECSPRLPAEHFKVKKEGKNQGRWFYTCQNQEPKRCGFFLWDEDAKPREEAAVLGGSRTEPLGRKSGGGDVQEGWDAGRAHRAARTDGTGVNGKGQNGMGMFAHVNADDEETASPTPSPVSPPPAHAWLKRSPAPNNRVKRSAQQAALNEDEDDEVFPWPLTGQEESELAKAADSAVAAPETPHKAQKTGVYATPATTGKRKLPWLEPQQAPITPDNISAKIKTANGVSDSPSTRLGAVTPVLQAEAPPTAVAATTPSPPIRYKDALNNPADSGSTLTTEALAVLQPAKIPPEIREKLRSILSKHDLRFQGITRGRDISRLAIAAKDAKIAELGATIVGLENARIAELLARIGSLEAEREVDRAVIGALRAQVRDGEGAGADPDSQETLA